MTSKLVMAGFAAGAALAGMIVGAARLTGVAEPATAVAEEPAESVHAAGTGATLQPSPREVSAGEKERWRGKSGRSSDVVPAGVLARVASRRELERGDRCRSAREEPVGPPVADAEGQRCRAGGDRIESVEIEWNGSPATP